MAVDDRRRVTIRMEPALHATLQDVAQRQHVSLDQLVGLYCTQGLAREDVPPLDEQAVVALRTLLEEVIERRVEQRIEVQANDLAKLILRSIRQAALAHRFLYHSIARTDRARADAIEQQAAEDTSWLLASNVGDEAPL